MQLLLLVVVFDVDRTLCMGVCVCVIFVLGCNF